MQLIVEKKGHRLLVLLALAIAGVLLLLVAQDSEAVHNDRLLELDGNAAFNGGRGPNAGDSPCDGAIPTAAPFLTPPAPPDCIQTATPATFDWAASVAGNGTGVCKGGANDPATSGNEANLIDEDTKPATAITSICVRDFAVGTVDGPALGQGTPSCPSGTACQIGDTADLTYHTGSDKDFQEIWDGSSADWGCKEQANATNKADLLNAYFVRASNAAGDDIFYFGAERASENGSVFNGFWFLQNRVADDCPRNLPWPSGVGDFCSQTTLEDATCTAPNQSKHQDKDVLILFNYDNGGRIGSIGAYVWDNAAVASVTPGIPCPNGLGTRTPADNLCVVENLDLNEPGGEAGDCRARATTNALCGRVNGAPTCAQTRSRPEICSGPGAFSTPWAPGCVSGGANCRSPFQLASPTFSEGGVNLTSLGIDLGCVQGFLAESRSSPSVDATLKDYTMGGLPPCGLAWEKRDESVAGNPLQGGATFTITPGPFGGANLVVTDCVAIPCAAGGDDDPDAGSFNLGDVQPANYQVCETTAPTGYARDNNLCRNVTVSSDTPNVVIGTQDIDDCAHATPDEQDFCNRLGTIEWEKRDDQGNLQGGATFTVGQGATPADGDGNGPFACHDANNTGDDDKNPVTVLDNSAPDADADSGQLKLERVCLGNYVITETVSPTGFALDDDPTRPCNVTEAAPNCVVGGAGDDIGDTDEADFHNRLGSIQWEKRSDVDGALQAGATFNISPNPYSCHSPSGTDPSPISDDADNTDGPAGNGDEDGTGGQLKLDRVCLGTYTITEATPPPGFALDPDNTREITVSATELHPVVGTQGTADDCPDGGNVDTDESDFCNLVGSLYWEKRGKDVATPETGNELLPGFGFTVTGTGVNVVVPDCTSGPCPAGGDQNPDVGKFCLDLMPIGVVLSIDETTRATGYIQTSPANNGDLTKTLSASSKCSGGATSANDAGDFLNQPLSKFEIEFICIAPSPSDPSKCATAAKITCPTPAILPTPNDLTPAAFDDIKEVYGDGTTGLLEGTYNCEIVIDP